MAVRDQSCVGLVASAVRAGYADVRGRANLEIVKQIDEEALEAFVPSMLLQPIVENCLKHGLAPKIDGGRIELRTANRDGRLRIEIEDNGVGISEEKMPHVYVEGIG